MMGKNRGRSQTRTTPQHHVQTMQHAISADMRGRGGLAIGINVNGDGIRTDAKHHLINRTVGTTGMTDAVACDHQHQTHQH